MYDSHVITNREKAHERVILKELDWHNYEEDWPVIRREAVRGIICNKEGKYAFVQSRLYGECKFPGLHTIFW